MVIDPSSIQALLWFHTKNRRLQGSLSTETRVMVENSTLMLVQISDIGQIQSLLVGVSAA